MAIDFSCRNAGHVGCGFSTRASSEDELVTTLAEHVKKAHGIEEPSATIVEYLVSTTTPVKGASRHG